MKGLYAIVDLPDPHGHTAAEMTAAVLGGRGRGGAGASVVQLRAKSATTTERVEMLESMAPLCDAAASLLVINDDIDAAIAGPAGGLHVGQGDPGSDDLDELRGRLRPGSVLGVSTHDRRQLQAACQQKPDYVALGPIAPTASKQNADPVVGFPGLLEGCRLATRPLVAIGGLDEQSGAKAVELGASSVALIGALRHERLAEVEARAVALAQAFERASAPLPFEQICAAIPVFAAEQLLEIARWSDDLALLIGMGLPARFRPTHDGTTAHYRPCDLLDLLYVLDKRPDESWDAWAERSDSDEARPLVQLRKP
ncbi:MAG: thiamine phosphate synthase [Nannocystaceae bacterium]|nr:thiamine phosphate synthase [Nannocystaceae bacterium]